MLAAALFTALALVVPAPPAPGQWQQLGATFASRPGKPSHFFRTALFRTPTNPAQLGIVVRSSTSQTIRVSWFSYCEIQSDDYYTEQHQQTITGRHEVVAYPPVFSGATRCDIAINIRGIPHAAVAAAVFVDD
jgi:hypothetical protein